MIFHGGFYYYSETRAQREIFIRRSRTIAGIGRDPGVRVWTAPTLAKNSANLRSEEHTSELQSPCNLVCRLLLEKKKSTCARQSPFQHYPPQKGGYALV